jgi:hypothetical protein
VEDGQHGGLGLANARVGHEKEVLSLQYVGDGLPLGACGLMDVLVPEDLLDAGI